MICGQQEVQSTVYRRVQGRQYTWYVPVNDHAAEGIHLDVGDNGTGYGGKVIEFLLESGEVAQVKGPWRMRDGESLWSDAGLDVRATYWTKITVQDPDGSLLYREDQLVPGYSHRYLDVITELWNSNPALDKVHCRVDSRTMSRGGWISKENGGDVALIRSYVEYLTATSIDEYAA
jgi:hypothetical protein